jgi:hypothetical protein
LARNYLQNEDGESDGREERMRNSEKKLNTASKDNANSGREHMKKNGSKQGKRVGEPCLILLLFLLLSHAPSWGGLGATRCRVAAAVISGTAISGRLSDSGPFSDTHNKTALASEGKALQKGI